MTDEETKPMVPATIATGTKRGRVFSGHRIAMAVAGTIAVVALVFGAFLLGQSSRKSPEQVAQETAKTVKVAVQKAVDQKGADDKAKRIRIMHREATRLNAKHRAEINLLREVAAKKANRAYASGSTAGHRAGYSEGVDDGITVASDDLTCSDDPDVSLPYCNYDD